MSLKGLEVSSGEKARFLYEKPVSLDAYLDSLLNNITMGSFTLWGQTALADTGDLVILLDKEKAVVAINDVGVRLLGIKKEEAIGKDVEELLGFDALHVLLVGLSGHAGICKDFVINLPITKKPTKDFVLKAIELESFNQGLIGYLLVAAEKAQYKEREQRIKQLEKLAMIGQMAASIIHEIKNPIAVIKGFTQMLLRKIKECKELEYIKTIDYEVSIINEFVTDLLSMARSRELKLELGSVNEVIELLQTIIENKAISERVRISFILADKDLPVLLDENQLIQVLLNIALNAFDAVKVRSDPKVIIRTECACDLSKMLIVIEDNGSGIPRDQLPKLEQPFFSTKDNGTGLGLSVSYQIIKNHGGEIMVESEVGRGTSFTIALGVIEEFNNTENSAGIDAFM